MAILCELNATEKALLRHINKLLCLRCDHSDAIGACSIGVHSLVNQSCVDADDIALMQNFILARNSVYVLIIYRDAKRSRKPIIVQEIRHTAKAADHALTELIQLPSRATRTDRRLELLVYNIQQSSCFAHQLYLMCCLNRY